MKIKFLKKFQWSAPDGGVYDSEESKAVFLSVWNHESNKKHLKIDLVD